MLRRARQRAVSIGSFSGNGITLPTGITAGQLYYVVGSSGATCNLANTFGGSALTVSGSSSGTILYQGGLYEFWQKCVNTTRDGVNEVAMFTQFNALSVTAGANFPSKYTEVGPLGINAPWGALQYLGNGTNDDTPTWEPIKTWNQS